MSKDLQTWGDRFAGLLGNPALVGCSSLGVCPAGRAASAAITAAHLGEWMVRQVDSLVLLVEADLWRPQLASLLGSPPGPGLADAVLNPAVTSEEVVHQTRFARLNLLPAGKPLLGKTRKSIAAALPQHFPRLCGRFPNVIVTLPSATDPECSIFPFHLAHAVLLLVEPQQTSIREIQSASRRLRENGATLIGTMIAEEAAAAAGV